MIGIKRTREEIKDKITKVTNPYAKSLLNAVLNNDKEFFGNAGNLQELIDIFSRQMSWGVQYDNSDSLEHISLMYAYLLWLGGKND